MRISVAFKNAVVDIVRLLYILLFTYAAANKLLDFENFQVQLGQSPVLSSYAGFVSYIVPIIELLIVAMLLFTQTRYIGLLAAFYLMVMFSVYIFIILHFSPFVPCSCGGILEKLSWKQHLIFNIAFAIINLAALLIARSTEESEYIIKRRVQIPVIILGGLLSIGLVAVLFLLSENAIHHRNNFVRRFPHHPVFPNHEIDLEQYTYYIAGVEGDKIYLGNSFAPLAMTVIDTTLKQKSSYRIKLPIHDYKYQSVRVAVIPPYFYVSDGTVPVVYRGNISDWEASVYMQGSAYFTHVLPATKHSMIIRALSSRNRENILGAITIHGDTAVTLSDKLLVKQIDGVFDTDGTMVYNYQLNKLIYTYFYRNEFIVADTLLHLYYRGNTIDTTTRAKIKVAYISSKQESKLAIPPHIVNKNTATFSKYLFVDAGLMGKYEDTELWDSASIVDVYDLENKTYDFSFYIEDRDKQKMSDFQVNDHIMIAITGRYLSTYKLRPPFDFRMKKMPKKKVF